MLTTKLWTMTDRETERLLRAQARERELAKRKERRERAKQSQIDTAWEEWERKTRRH